MKIYSKVSIKHALFLSILLLVLATQTSLGEIPKQISYQGVLTDEAGKPADGFYDITFRIYTQQGETLWSEAQDVEVSKGVFNAILGSREPLNLPFDKPYLLGITVDDTELQPRIPLTASPYSLNAPSINGGDGSPWEIKNGNVCLLNGNVGIGTTSPEKKLHINIPNGGNEVRLTSSNVTFGIGIPYANNAGFVYTRNAYPIMIGTNDAERIRITSDGNVGMVVSIDTKNPGELIVSSKSYDRTVAGIISGAGGVKPGMLMSQTGTIADGNHPVALTGRVYCLADASNGAIQPGDLLTTSDTPGHAMKVTDYTRAHGTILGKAMSALEEGRGLVLVLVTLH